MIDAVLRAAWGDLAEGLNASVSAGFSSGDAVLVDAVVEEADRRLYRAKERGRGCLVGIWEPRSRSTQLTARQSLNRGGPLPTRRASRPVGRSSAGGRVS
jgi:hypothetical protein